MIRPSASAFILWFAVAAVVAIAPALAAAPASLPVLGASAEVGTQGKVFSPAQDPDPQAAATPEAYVIRIEGSLNAGHQALFQRAVKRAKADDAVLVVAFDTPGGALTQMRQFAAAVDAEVRGGQEVIGWVDTQALSAGTWIAISCSSLYMRTRSTIGSAAAIRLVPGGAEAVEEKIASSYRAWVRGWAEDHGKSPLLAQAMIDIETSVIRVRIDGLEELISGRQWDDLAERGEEPERLGTVVSPTELWALTGTEAIEYGFADAMAESLDEVLSKQGLAGVKYEELPFSRSEEWLSQLWDMRLLFLFLGLFFGYVELKMPGFGVPGILSITAFVVMFTGQYLVGVADVPHIILASVGVLLVAVELFLFPGLIWPGVIGALALITGVLLAQVGPSMSFSSAWDREILFDATFQLAATASAALFSIWIISRYLPNTPLLGRMVLAGTSGSVADAMPEARAPERVLAARVGRRGRATTALRPVGKVDLDGDAPGLEYEARAEAGLIDAGQFIEVVEVHSGRLLVKAVTDGPSTSSTSEGPSPPHE